jgi:hypothetical protein
MLDGTHQSNWRHRYRIAERKIRMTTQDRPTGESNDGTNSPEEPLTEKMRIQGEAMVAKVKELLHEGNVQRIIVKDGNSHTVMEIPVNLGVVAAIVAPVLVAVAAVAALASDWNIEVYRSAPRASTTANDSHP